VSKLFARYRSKHEEIKGANQCFTTFYLSHISIQFTKLGIKFLASSASTSTTTKSSSHVLSRKSNHAG